jgi:hypothetical protein
MGGDARWTTAAIRMDNGSKILMNGSIGNGLWRRNERRKGNTIATDKVAQWKATQDGQQR